MSKLNEAKALVDELNRKAGEQSILLRMKQDEADAALQEITVSMQVLGEGQVPVDKQVEDICSCLSISMKNKIFNLN